MEGNYKVVTDDSNYNAEMTNAAGKLVVANFTSARCPPCQRIAPIFAAMAPKFPGAIFLSIDIANCPNAAQLNKITATPTFIFFRNKMILSLEFSAPVKVHSLRIHGPAERGPRTLRLFTNLPYGLDFDSAESNVAAQDLELSGKELKGELIKLKYMKFQSVNRLSIFIQDNQAGDEITQLNYIQVIGSPMTSTNMADFKRVAGKAGEGGH